MLKPKGMVILTPIKGIILVVILPMIILIFIQFLPLFTVYCTYIIFYLQHLQPRRCFGSSVVHLCHLLFHGLWLDVLEAPKLFCTFFAALPQRIRWSFACPHLCHQTEEYYSQDRRHPRQDWQNLGSQPYLLQTKIENKKEGSLHELKSSVRRNFYTTEWNLGVYTSSFSQNVELLCWRNLSINDIIS